MPVYEYKCENGHVFDVIQKMTDEALTECEVCGAPAVRVLHSPAVHFKGSGFYNTDYGRKGSGGGNGASSSEKSTEKKSSDSKSGESKSGESKSSESKSSDSKSSDSKSGDSKAKASTTD